jgi:hypothetical protein
MNLLKGRVRFFVVASYLSVLFCGGARAGIIGLDARPGMSAHNVFSDGFAFASFRATLESAGHILVPISSFLASDLAGLDAVFMKHPYTSYMPGEVDALVDFVGAGHGMVLCADTAGSPGVPNLNDFAGRYGVTFSTALTEGNGLTIKNFNAHPITEGLTTIGVDYQRKITGFTGGAVDLTRGTGTKDFIAVNGKAVFLSDSSLFSTYTSNRPLTFEDNARLLTNIANYVAVPEPRSAALFMLFVPAVILRRAIRVSPSMGTVNRVGL